MRSFNFRNQSIVPCVKRSYFIFLFLVMIIILNATPVAWADPKYGGTLRLLGEVDAMGFDAIKARSAVGGGRAAGSLVMEKLFARDKNDDIISILGISAQSSEDGKTWTIELRKGVRFHDGTPFNADAVVHHWQRLLDPKNRYRQRMLFRPIIGIEKTGEYEVRFLLKHAWLPFMAVLTDGAGGGGVAYWAHIGGFVYGAAFAGLVKRNRVEERFIEPSIDAKVETTVIENPVVEQALAAQLLRKWPKWATWSGSAVTACPSSAPMPSASSFWTRAPR